MKRLTGKIIDKQVRLKGKKVLFETVVSAAIDDQQHLFLSHDARVWFNKERPVGSDINITV